MLETIQDHNYSTKGLLATTLYANYCTEGMLEATLDVILWNFKYYFVISLTLYSPISTSSNIKGVKKKKKAHSFLYSFCFWLKLHENPPKHVWIIWVSDEACRSAMGLWWSMSVSDGSPVRHVGLRWVSGSNNILVNSISNCFANFYLLNILANLGRKYNLNKKVEPDWGSPQLQFILMIVVLFYCCNY